MKSSASSYTLSFQRLLLAPLNVNVLYSLCSSPASGDRDLEECCALFVYRHNRKRRWRRRRGGEITDLWLTNDWCWHTDDCVAKKTRLNLIGSSQQSIQIVFYFILYCKSGPRVRTSSCFWSDRLGRCDPTDADAFHKSCICDWVRYGGEMSSEGLRVLSLSVSLTVLCQSFRTLPAAWKWEGDEAYTEPYIFNHLLHWFSFSSRVLAKCQKITEEMRITPHAHASRL